METTEETTSFIDDLLVEAEAKEQDQALAYIDLVIAEIARIESDISEVNSNCNAEVVIIKDWSLKRSSKLSDRIDFLKLKLESFIRKQEKKTIDLPHGTLKLRQKPDRVEIIDLEQFLSKANEYLITTKPEEIKPNLTKIKKHITMTNHIPDGVQIIEGKTEFSLKLKETNHDSKKEV